MMARVVFDVSILAVRGGFDAQFRLYWSVGKHRS